MFKYSTLLLQRNVRPSITIQLIYSIYLREKFAPREILPSENKIESILIKIQP